MPAARSAVRLARARRAAARIAPAAAALALLSACSGGSSPTPSGGQASATSSVSAPASAAPSQAAGGPTPPGIVAVTTAGALVVLHPRTGTVARTLVPSGVTGDEITVSGNGTVYFATKHGCTTSIPPRSALQRWHLPTAMLRATCPAGAISIALPALPAYRTWTG